MSQWRARIEEDDQAQSVLDWADENYHLVLGALLVGFMLWTRLRNVGQFVQEDGTVLFSGNDAWYHYRQVSYTVQNWPATMPFDPWTYFPYGTSSGQFGTFFDQLVATVALIVGLGAPGETVVGTTLLVAPVVLAVLAVVPTYLIGRRLGGRLGGVVAMTVLALSAGSFLNRSMAGFSDHHVAESLFQATAVLAVMIAVTVAEREKPIYEQFVSRDFEGLRRPLGWSAIAGVAITTYLWVWPPGVLVIGIVGVFLLLQMCVEVVRGESPEHTAIAGATTMSVAAVTVLTAFQVPEITATDFSFLQPLLALFVAAGCVFMAWLAREWEARNVERTFYPLAVFGIILAGVLALRLASPDTYGYFVNQVLRVVGFTESPAAQGATIGEVQPLSDPGRLFTSYGFAIVLALLGGLLIVARELFGERVPAEQLLVVVWALFITAATFTQNRFQYYLVFPVAILTGYFVTVVAGRAWPDDGVDQIETYQVITVLSLVLVLVLPMFLVTPTALDYASFNGPDQGVQGWEEGMSWMEENTPAVGAFNGSEPSLEYYGTYSPTSDFDYEEGDYGVLSWWDYGHWITAMGERIPNANPFQQGATNAANFLLSPTESQAREALDEFDEDDAKTRYVVVDWKMATVYSGQNYDGKFFAPPAFYDKENVTPADYYTRYRPVFFSSDSQLYFHVRHQEYYETMLTRLYEFHGSSVQPTSVAVDWNNDQSGRQSRRVAATTSEQPSPIRQFNDTAEAREFVESDGSAAVGGIGPNPPERVAALDHYRLVGTSERSATSSRNYNRGLMQTALGTGIGFTQTETRAACDTGVTWPAPTRSGNYYCMTERGMDVFHKTPPKWTKVFERVPGGTVEGTGPANATVTASVQMNMPHSEETFTYTQQTQTNDDGEFTMTVPYSTTGYDEWGTDEGHTNVSVRASSSYQFQALGPSNGSLAQWGGQTDVTEGQVVGEDDSTATVELEPITADSVQVNPTESSGGASPGDSSGDDGSAGGADEGTSGDESAGSIAPSADARAVGP